MSIFGIAGAIGTGKSFTQLKLALEYCDERQKQLVTNFALDLKALKAYCELPKWVDNPVLGVVFPPLIRAGILKPSGSMPRLPWVLKLIKEGGILQIPYPDNIEALMVPESVVCLDEAGILLNSRDFAKTPKKLLADLAQSRKDGIDLFWAAQFDEQVDRQFRLLTQYWIHCDSLSVYSKELRRPKLIYKRIYWFRAAEYFDWLNNSKDRTSHFKTRFAYASRYIGGTLSYSDSQLFKVFDSFSRLDIRSGVNRISSIHQCRLPKNYYASRLTPYARFRDPLTYYYDPSRLPPLPSTAPPLPPRSSVGVATATADYSSLVRSALSLSRSKGIKNPPYFRSMDASQLSKWISDNS